MSNILQSLSYSPDFPCVLPIFYPLDSNIEKLRSCYIFFSTLFYVYSYAAIMLQQLLHRSIRPVRFINFSCFCRACLRLLILLGSYSCISEFF